MSGHLFVAHGDLRTLVCDHWLLPVDRGLSASYSWNRTDTWHTIWPHLPRRMNPGQRVVEVHSWTGSRRPWPTNVASGGRTPASWQGESVAQFLEAASRAPATLGRARPLLGIPIVGTGYGGKRRQAGEVLGAVLPVVYTFLAHHDVDVALITWTEEDYAAAQAARRTCATQGHGVWTELSATLEASARHLAGLAAKHQLSVFMGAGVSAAAGLPTWDQLLDRLAAESGLDEPERRSLSRLGVLDRAQLVAQRLGPDPDALGHAVRRCLDVGDAVALSHCLLAGLPVREFITTNYDDCFERACQATGRPVARLPYAPATEARRWLLKMHGCVQSPSDIVLTRRDYVRYAERSAALAGIVQAMLITRHMLFVGFSLNDDNFHRIVDAVRRALTAADRDRLGTVVALFEDPLLEQLWDDDLSWVHCLPGSGGSLPEAARRFEIFLDALGFHATAPHHLLQRRFHDVLTPQEAELKRLLGPVQKWVSRHRKAPDPSVAAAWALLANALRDLGDADE